MIVFILESLHKTIENVAIIRLQQIWSDLVAMEFCEFKLELISTMEHVAYARLSYHR